MTIVVAVPCTQENPLTMIVALACIKVVEMYDAVATARIEGVPFDPREDDYDEVTENLRLVHVEDTMFLCCDVEEMTVTDVATARASVGEFAKHLRTLYDEPMALVETEECDLGGLLKLMHHMHIEMPGDADHRLRRLVHKHAPAAVGKKVCSKAPLTGALAALAQVRSEVQLALMSRQVAYNYV